MASATERLNSPTAQPEDPHVAWAAEARALADQLGTARGRAEDRLARQLLSIERKIASTPARTVAGLLVQARALRQELDRGGDSFDELAARALVEGLERLAANA